MPTQTVTEDIGKRTIALTEVAIQTVTPDAGKVVQYESDLYVHDGAVWKQPELVDDVFDYEIDTKYPVFDPGFVSDSGKEIKCAGKEIFNDSQRSSELGVSPVAALGGYCKHSHDSYGLTGTVNGDLITFSSS